LTASVATSGVTRSRVMAIPQTHPDSAPVASAASIHGSNSALSPLGNLVTNTAASEMTPGTVRSRPPCWTTKVWPIDAIARTAANEDSVNSELADTLPGASHGATRNSNIVASQMARNFGCRISGRENELIPGPVPPLACSTDYRCAVTLIGEGSPPFSSK
jgi:hypothetical protein